MVPADPPDYRGRVLAELPDAEDTPMSAAVITSGSESRSEAVTALVSSVVSREISGRIPDLHLDRYIAAEPDPRRPPGRLDEAPPVHLTPWTEERADRLAGSVGALIVVSDCTPAGTLPQIIDDMSSRRVRVEVVETGTDAPDPIHLSRQLYPRPKIEARRDFLRLTGLIPTSGPYLVSSLDKAPPGTDVAVGGLAFRAGVRVCDLLEAVEPLDLIAAVDGAEFLVTDSPALTALGAALDRPTVCVIGRWPGGVRPAASAALVVEGPDDIRRLDASAVRAGWNSPADTAVAAAEAMMDELAGRIREECDRQTSRSPQDEIAELRERVTLLEQTNAGLRQRLEKEREVLLDYVRSAALNQPVHPAATPMDLDVSVQLRGEVRHLREELDRVYATKTMRALDPARRIYGLVRSHRP